MGQPLLSWDQALRREVTSDRLRCFTLYEPQSALSHPPARDHCLLLLPLFTPPSGSPPSLCSVLLERAVPSFSLVPGYLENSFPPLPANQCRHSSFCQHYLNLLPAPSTWPCWRATYGGLRQALERPEKGAQAVLGGAPQPQALSLVCGRKPSTARGHLHMWSWPRGDPAKGRGRDRAPAPARLLAFPKGLARVPRVPRKPAG